MSNGPAGSPKKVSIACTRINNEPLSTSLLGRRKETNAFNSIFNKADETRFNHIANETHVVTPAVLEDWVYINDRPVQTGFPCQQPQERDEAYAADTHPSQNELSYSAVTRGKGLWEHPVVGQLTMIGTRLAFPQQDHQKSTNDLRWHPSRAVFDELPRQTQNHLVA